MKDFSYITNSSPAFIENMYKEFSGNPESVDVEFRKFFEGFDFAISHGNGNGSVHAAPALEKTGDSGLVTKEFSVYQLIQAYRKKGHLLAKTNPIRARKDRGA